MKKIFGPVVALVMTMWLAGLANAATYYVSFTPDDPNEIMWVATLTVDDANLVIDITGAVNGSDTITGVVAPGNPTFTSTWTYNDLFDADSSPFVDNSGILFSTISGLYVNLYSVGTTLFSSFQPGTGSQYNPGVQGTLTVAAVPLPASALLLLSAMSAMFLRRKLAGMILAGGNWLRRLLPRGNGGLKLA